MDEDEKKLIQKFAGLLADANLVHFMHDLMEQDIEDEDDGSGNGRTYEQLTDEIFHWAVNHIESGHDSLSGVLACIYNYSKGERSRISQADLNQVRLGKHRRV